MKKRIVRAARLPETSAYAHVVTASGGTTIYIADYGSEYREPLKRIRERFFSPSNLPVCTGVGVQALGRPGLMIEVDATAVID